VAHLLEDLEVDQTVVVEDLFGGGGGGFNNTFGAGSQSSSSLQRFSGGSRDEKQPQASELPAGSQRQTHEEHMGADQDTINAINDVMQNVVPDVMNELYERIRGQMARLAETHNIEPLDSSVLGLGSTNPSLSPLQLPTSAMAMQFSTPKKESTVSVKREHYQQHSDYSFALPTSPLSNARSPKSVKRFRDGEAKVQAAEVVEKDSFSPFPPSSPSLLPVTSPLSSPSLKPMTYSPSVMSSISGDSLEPDDLLAQELEEDEQMMVDEEDKGKKRRSKLPGRSIAILRDWFIDHVDKPYPTTAEKAALANKAQLLVSQTNNWFTNTRKRFWMPFVESVKKPTKNYAFELDTAAHHRLRLMLITNSDFINQSQ